jgi:hypothetical protein
MSEARLIPRITSAEVTAGGLGMVVGGVAASAIGVPIKDTARIIAKRVDGGSQTIAFTIERMPPPTSHAARHDSAEPASVPLVSQGEMELTLALPLLGAAILAASAYQIRKRIIINRYLNQLQTYVLEVQKDKPRS